MMFSILCNKVRQEHVKFSLESLSNDEIRKIVIEWNENRRHFFVEDKMYGILISIRAYENMLRFFKQDIKKHSLPMF